MNRKLFETACELIADLKIRSIEELADLLAHNNDYKEDIVRGLLSLWASKRKAWVEYKCKFDLFHPHDEISGTGNFAFRRVVNYGETDYPGIEFYDGYKTFDEALIYGIKKWQKEKNKKWLLKNL